MENQEQPKFTFNDLMRDKIVPRIDQISMFILAIALVFKILHYPGASPMLGISMTTLAVTTWLMAFLTKAPTLYSMIFMKVGFISSSIILVGIMFTFLHLPGNSPMLEIGLTSGGISAIALAYMTFLQGFDELKKSFYRISITFSAGLLILLEMI